MIRYAASRGARRSASGSDARMPLDPRTPVLVGCGQVVQRVEDPLAAEEPLLLMARALERAAEDAGAPALLARADSIRVCQGLWRYENPGAWLAERFGTPAPETALGGISGTTVQSMLSDAAREILAGRRDVVLLAGAEAEHSKRRAERAGAEPRRADPSGPPPSRRFGVATHFRENPDIEAGLVSMPLVFALFEVALRHRLGLTPEAHRRRIGELWHRFAEVAAANPYAWIRTPPTAEAIAQPGPGNRMVVAPYTKLLVANMVVDQAAALLLCSAGTAKALGIPERRFVYPLAATEAVVVRTISERVALDEEPPMRLAGRRALELAGVAPEGLDFVDLYSCFPASVQLGAEALGLSLERPLTVTGGLTFAGGPFNSYVMHAIAIAVERLRERSGATALVSSVGGFFSKHAYGVYGGEPPAGGFRFEDLADEVAALPRRAFERGFQGDVEVESYGVVHDREGRPERAVIACRTPEGARTWAQSADPQLLARLLEADACGWPARVGADRALDLA